MPTEDVPHDAIDRLLALSAPQQQRFLARYALELTIHARIAFLEDQTEHARLCNETLHRLCGYLLGVMSEKKSAIDDASFMEMLVAGAAQKGWTTALQRALQSVLYTADAELPA